MPLPKVIFFDAVGTLFGVRGSVGAVYADLAKRFGVTVDAAAVDRAFFKSFKAATPMAFPGTDPTEIPDREYAWWWAIAAETFQEVGVLNQFADFSAFFSALYDHFAAADPWFVYADTLSTLGQWRDRGVELGVLSNFDSRIHSVLEALDLANYFSSVTISTEAGVSKPDAQIFQLALKKHDCPPAAAWHVGDSFREDYEGATRAGLRGIWLKRE
ncbi:MULTISPECIES: HAD-IA family hydrolase [Cyanophyceae]|uniref:HAD-IA family hydrolase n=1 Tax=Cyanophyceae TaxID=3028117 RepID=UPI00074D43B7|nr:MULTISPECIES: HAD-IA family hydrolase [Cyanophyceae]MBF2084272.1 HAD-IA family hydrolase [Thermoleptolyngbya sp. C42_A2020_037]BAU43113.1 Pyrimidine 5'-nucleotidase YjjG [Leptolyngbya sp. O-77]